MPAHFDILIEEPSMEAFLNAFLPRLLGESASFALYQHQCKDRLLKVLPNRFAGYARYLPDETKIVILLDRDDDSCLDLKRRIEEMALQAGLRVKSRSEGGDWQVAVRIVVEELEAWYFGEWSAVTAAYPGVSATVPLKEKFRDPDNIQGGTWEAFLRVLRQYGYYKGGLRKTEAAREMGSRISADASRSRSFRVFVDLLKAAS
jgi:hypothetical protein